jgi:predicted nucleotidyltransferase component of viral defense system
MTLPDWLLGVLPDDTAATWELLVPVLPAEVYLAGGTGLAVHLQHRVSRDLDFFYHDNAVDLDELQTELSTVGPFAVTDRASGTLNGVVSRTKVQFLHADEAAAQSLLEPTAVVAGLRVAGIGDILAMKLKVIAERGELRDYFDIMTIEAKTGRTVEEGLSLFLARYRRDPTLDVLSPVVRALGYLDDVDEDASLPVDKQTIAAYWRQRQPQIVSSLGRQMPAPVTPLPATERR